MIFDKTLCINNIKFIAKEKGLNIGDLETGAGVSVGYLSRLSKADSKSTPSIEVLVSIAEKLGISIDNLISVDYAGLSPSEKYIVDFIEKLIDATKKCSLTWDKEAVASFANIDRYRDDTTSHPLFIARGNGVIYNSYFSNEKGTEPGGEFFHASIGSGNTLYLTKVQYENASGDDYEVYIVSEDTYNNSFSVEPVCATNPVGQTVFDELLARLYNIIKDSCRNVKINGIVKNAIDNFMRPPIDNDDGLPF